MNYQPSTLSYLSALSVEAAIDPEPLLVPPDIRAITAIEHMSQVRSFCLLPSGTSAPSSILGEEARSSCVVVMEGQQPIGLLTEREIVRFMAQGMDMERIPITEVMTPNLIVLHRSECRDVFYLLNVFAQHQIRHLPIVEDSGRLAGLVTVDTLRQTLELGDFYKLRQVAEVMTPEVIRATPTASVAELIHLMAEYRVGCVAIEPFPQDSSGAVGIVTESDLVQVLALGLDPRQIPAQAIANWLPAVLRPSDSLWIAHQQMQQHKVRYLAVRGSEDEPIGIITQGSLLRLLTPMELYGTLQKLRQQIYNLKTEKIALLEKHHEELEQEASKFKLGNQMLQQEIERRQQVELALRNSEELSLVTFEKAAVGMFHCQLDGRFLRVNQRFCHLVGYSPEELQQQTLFQMTHAEDTQFQQDWIARSISGQKRSRSFSSEQRYLHQDGSELWINLTLSVVANAAGEPEYLIGVVEDISDRKYGEELLQDSEERFQAIFEQAAVGMEICTLEGRFFRLNQKFCDIVGYSRIELLERTFQDITHPEDLPESLELKRQLLAGEIPYYSLEERYVRQDGSIVWVNMMLSLMRDATGEPKYFIGVVEDINARKQAEVALRESEERFRSMFENHKSIMLLIEPETGEIIDANQAAEKFYNRAQDDLCSLTFFDLNQFPKDQVAQEMIEAKLELKNTFVFPHKLANGDVRWVEVYSSPIEYQGKQLLFSIIHDITDRKEAEEALKESRHFVQQIADSTPNILYLYDLIEQRNVYVNHEITTILGYTPEEFQEIGLSEFETLIHPEDHLNFKKYIHQFKTARADNIFELEYRMQNANGQWRWLCRRDTLFNRTQEGKPKQILGTATDITERKQMEEQLQQANQELQNWVNKLEVRNSEMKLLRQMSDFLQACLTVEEAYGAIADLLKPLFPNCSGGVFALNPSSSLVEAVATWGEKLHSETLFNPHECWSLRRGLLHDAEHTRPSLFCQHVHKHPAPAETLCVPMMAQGETMGLLYLNSPNPGDFSESKHQLARTVSEHLSLALANLKLRETLHNQSIRDPLTGLFNRRYMEESLQREIHRADRNKQALGLIMIDVDHFKRFNDTWGHEAGDLVLRELSQFLQKSIRVSDIACRYGGEELTLIFPEMSLEETYKRAEELRQGIKEFDLKYHESSLGAITISLGVASFPQHGKTSDSLIQLADAALYRAKAEGRDRVVAAP
jgi:diguanylate cyclase (GGDEF)-like protein/PAS domain S-box-containing protein